MANLAEKLPEGMKGRSYIIRASKSVEERFIGNANIFTEDEWKKLLKIKTNAPSPEALLAEKYKKMSKYDDTTKMQYIDLTNWLPGDILQKADRMSMANSLELRVPFLDKEVFKVASSLPTRLRCNKSNTKYAMRKAAVKRMPEATAEK